MTTARAGRKEKRNNMTVGALIKLLEKIDPDKCCIITENTQTDKDGWANIELVTEHQYSVYFTPEKYPVFSDN